MNKISPVGYAAGLYFWLITCSENKCRIAATMAEFQKDSTAQVESGNKAAGTSARKASLEIEKALKEFRKVSVDATK